MRPSGRSTVGPKQAYQQRLEAQLREWDAKIEEMRGKADKVQVEARIGYYVQIEEFRARRDVVERKLQELRRAGDEAWQELEPGTEAAWAELKRAFEALASRLA